MLDADGRMLAAAVAIAYTASAGEMGPSLATEISVRADGKGPTRPFAAAPDPRRGSKGSSGTNTYLYR